MDTMNKVKEIYPDITSPSMMQECGKNKNNDNNEIKYVTVWMPLLRENKHAHMMKRVHFQIQWTCLQKNNQLLMKNTQVLFTTNKK